MSRMNGPTWRPRSAGSALRAADRCSPIPGGTDCPRARSKTCSTNSEPAGGEAIEVITGSHSPDQYSMFAAIADAHGLLASRGSDFHAPGEANADFGKLPALPRNLTPVWHDWKL